MKVQPQNNLSYHQCVRSWLAVNVVHIWNRADAHKRTRAVQWGARHTVPDSWLLLGPEIRASESKVAMGGATAFLVQCEPKFIKLPHANPVFFSQLVATVR